MAAGGKPAAIAFVLNNRVFTDQKSAARVYRIALNVS
jgi:hypothetical protein